MSCLIAATVRGQYVAKFLPLPTGLTTGQVFASLDGQPAGSTATYYPQATLWNGSAPDSINLNRWQYGSLVYAVTKGIQGGLANVTSYTTHGSGRGGGGSRTYLIPHGVIWKGSAATAVDLNPNGMYESTVLGLQPGTEVGWASPSLFGPVHAQLWKDTAASATDLNPTGWINSQATAVSKTTEVGYGETSTYATHAVLWKGTAASAVDLHPTKLTAFASYALAVYSSSNVQVGALDFGSAYVPNEHACMWKGTAASAIDLHPTGFSISAALAVYGTTEAGYAVTSAAKSHAMIWKGSAASALDLQAFLPASYVQSAATGIDPDGSIVGWASNGTYRYPVVWTPENFSSVSVSQDIPFQENGWANETVTLTLEAPFTTPGTSIRYSINGGSFKTASSVSTAVPFSTTGCSVVEMFAVDGKGATSGHRLYTLNIDKTPPQTILTFPNLTLNLSATDLGSGVASTSYVLDGGSVATYVAPILLPNINHTLSYWSTDSVGNVEAKNTVTLAAVAPTLSSISPNILLSGSPDLTLTLTGSGFISGSTVTWKGANLTTTFISPTQLQAIVPASDLALAGTATVAVTNPSAGTGTSKTQTFAIQQRAVANGNAASIGDNGGLDLSPVTTYSGFTLKGNSVHVLATTSTAFYDSFGNSISYTTFFDMVQDNQALTVIGTFDATTGYLTAQSIQMQ